MLFSKDSKCSDNTLGVLNIKTRHLCPGNRLKLPGSSRNSECHFKTKKYFLEKHMKVIQINELNSYNELYLIKRDIISLL